jgi:hypothetical protein
MIGCMGLNYIEISTINVSAVTYSGTLIGKAKKEDPETAVRPGV